MASLRAPHYQSGFIIAAAVGLFFWCRKSLAPSPAQNALDVVALAAPPALAKPSVPFQMPLAAKVLEPDAMRGSGAPPRPAHRSLFTNEAICENQPATSESPPDLKARVEQLSSRLRLLAEGGLLSTEDQAELGRLLAISADRALAWVVLAKSETDRASRLTACLALWSRLDFESAWKWAGAQPDLIPALAVLSSSSDPLAAATVASNWVNESPENSLERFAYFTRVLRDTGQKDANVVFADSLPPEYRGIAIQSALTELAAADPEKALAYARLKADRQEQRIALQAVVTGWPASRLKELLVTLSPVDSPEAVEYATERLNATRGE